MKIASPDPSRPPLGGRHDDDCTIDTSPWTRATRRGGPHPTRRVDTIARAHAPYARATHGVLYHRVRQLEIRWSDDMAMGRLYATGWCGATIGTLASRTVLYDDVPHVCWKCEAAAVAAGAGASGLPTATMVTRGARRVVVDSRAATDTVG